MAFDDIIDGMCNYENSLCTVVISVIISIYSAIWTSSCIFFIISMLAFELILFMYMFTRDSIDDKLCEYYVFVRFLRVFASIFAYLTARHLMWGRL